MYTSHDETNSLNYEGAEFLVSICLSRKEKKGRRRGETMLFLLLSPMTCLQSVSSTQRDRNLLDSTNKRLMNWCYLFVHLM